MYKLAIIGGGPAGYTAAERAAHHGLTSVIFEKKTLGGTCLNEGCIPTKALLYGAKTYTNALNAAKYGVNVPEATFDYAKMHSRKTKVVRKLVAGIKAKLNNELTTLVAAEASVVAYDKDKVVIQANGETYEAENLLLCCGSENIVPPIPGIDSSAVWNSTDALNCNQLPTSMAIVGGGVIGMEFAALFCSLGVKVSVIEMMPEILGNMDRDTSAMLREDYTKRGIDFYLQARVTAINGNTVCFTHEEQEKTIEAEHILVSVGRKASIQGLECLPLEYAKKGIAVDEHMRTNLPNVYAAGDITGFSMLAHTAVREAEVAVHHLAGVPDAMSYNAIPGVVYTCPEVAGVGQTELSLQQVGTAYEVAKLPMTFSGRFVAENEGVNGLCKVIYAADTHKILGIHMFGNPASEIINMAALAIEQGLTVEQWRNGVVGHPTVSEIIKETLWTV